MNIIIEPKKAATYLGAIIAFLIAAYIAGFISRYFLGHDYVFGLVPLFDLDVEGNIPSLFSSVSILLCSGLLYIIGTAHMKDGNKESYYWMGLAAIFLFLALDEGATIHERLIGPMKEIMEDTGYPYLTWVVPYIIFSTGIGLIYLRFLLNLQKRFRILIIISGIIYIIGALGFEPITPYYYEISHKKDIIFSTIIMVEESFEMIGILLFIYTLLSYISLKFDKLCIRFNAGNSH